MGGNRGVSKETGNGITFSITWKGNNWKGETRWEIFSVFRARLRKTEFTFLIRTSQNELKNREKRNKEKKRIRSFVRVICSRAFEPGETRQKSTNMTSRGTRTKNAVFWKARLMSSKIEKSNSLLREKKIGALL